MGKLRKRVKEYGWLGATKLTWAKLFRTSRREILKLPTPEARFTKIYETNNWSNPESVSGEGSTLTNTANLRAALPGLFERHRVKTFLDAPCGDFHWMKHVVNETDITYIGGDIVKPLIEEISTKYGDERRSFLHLDITTGDLPKADMMMCRDCLFHLSYDDIFRFFTNFADSEIPLLLTTTKGIPGAPIENHNITTGRMRPIDIFNEPFNLPKNFIEKIDDTAVLNNEARYMVMFTREQIAETVSNRDSRFS